MGIRKMFLITKEIFYWLIAIYLTMGFATFFSNVFHNNPIDVFVLMTLPLIIGALLINNDNLKPQGYWFLMSSIFMFASFFLLLSTNVLLSQKLAVISIWGGAFIFLITMLHVCDKVMEELIKLWEERKKE